MNLNAAGLAVDGHLNPNWKGGLIDKVCQICEKPYQVKRVHSASRFCSMKCVGLSQRGKPTPKTIYRRIEKLCEICGASFEIFSSQKNKYKCCSQKCSDEYRSRLMAAEGNPNWNGGISRLPYPWNFSKLSRLIIKRDGSRCANPLCDGADSRLTTHHINYVKQDCRPENLICLCSSCNSKANFGRSAWIEFYQAIIASKKAGGGWDYEVFG